MEILVGATTLIYLCNSLETSLEPFTKSNVSFEALGVASNLFC